MCAWQFVWISIVSRKERAGRQAVLRLLHCIANIPPLLFVFLFPHDLAYDFHAPFEDYELAKFCQKEKVDTLLMNIAWLASDQDENEQGKKTENLSNENQIQNAQSQHLNYLAQRLSPLFISQDGQQPLQPIRFIACNRVGTEAGTVFAGTSFGMQFSPGSNPSVQGFMGREEGMMIIEM